MTAEYPGGRIFDDSCLPAIMRLLNTLPSPPTNLVRLVISIDFDRIDFFEMDWSPLISFPYFDVIPSIELQVSGTLRWGFPISSLEVLSMLRQSPHLAHLERHHESFLMKEVERLNYGDALLTFM